MNYLVLLSLCLFFFSACCIQGDDQIEERDNQKEEPCCIQGDDQIEERDNQKEERDNQKEERDNQKEERDNQKEEPCSIPVNDKNEENSIPADNQNEEHCNQIEKCKLKDKLKLTDGIPVKNQNEEREDQNREQICSVCLDLNQDTYIGDCSHKFCKGCIDTWKFNKRSYSCPLCNHVYDNSDVQEDNNATSDSTDDNMTSQETRLQDFFEDPYYSIDMFAAMRYMYTTSDDIDNNVTSDSTDDNTTPIETTSNNIDNTTPQDISED